MLVRQSLRAAGIARLSSSTAAAAAAALVAPRRHKSEFASEGERLDSWDRHKVPTRGKPEAPGTGDDTGYSIFDDMKLPKGKGDPPKHKLPIPEEIPTTAADVEGTPMGIRTQQFLVVPILGMLYLMYITIQDPWGDGIQYKRFREGLRGDRSDFGRAVDPKTLKVHENKSFAAMPTTE